MKDKIQKLIATGKTEEALELLRSATNEALLLQSQFTNGKKQFQLGMIEFGEWQRIVSRVSFAALELANNLEEPAKSGENSEPQKQNRGESSVRKVFISYNHSDGNQMRAIKSELERAGIQTTIDSQNLKPGHDIADFIKKAQDNCDYFLTVISRNSLLSNWVGFEILQALNQPALKSKWIPVRLDDSFLNSQFYFDAQDVLKKSVDESRQDMLKALQNDLDPAVFSEEHKRKTKLQQNLGEIIDALKRVNTMDLSNNFFDLNMPKLVQFVLDK